MVYMWFFAWVRASYPVLGLDNAIPDFIQLCFVLPDGGAARSPNKVTLLSLGDLDPLDGPHFLIHTEALKSVSGYVASFSPMQLVTLTTPKCLYGNKASHVSRLA